jgi:hypothetical protein
MNVKPLFIADTLGLASCTKTPLPATETVYDHSYLVLNEGAFTGGTATLTAIAPDSTVEQAFLTENGLPLGNIGQHMLLDYLQ